MRRRHLLVGMTTGLAGVAGCLGSGRKSEADSADGGTATTTMPELAAPSDRVDSNAYLTTLESRIDASGFPDPDPGLIPSLTEARFVVDAATDAGNQEFASAVSDLRRPVFEPLADFDATMARARETTVNDPEQFVEEHLSRRERTFLDYPAPPHHFIEAAENRGRQVLDTTARRAELREAVGDSPSTYVDHRLTVETVVAGGTDIGREVYPEWAERDSRSGIEYDSADHYADIVAFNGALAAEAMLEHNGKIVTPP
ncbi:MULTISPECIES: hypothetical protein [Halorussus]|uniref:hypothetical protein n=1 Tax=Halorussus TaxID=1070314 RepID=UPI000E215801|nr:MULTISPECIES: hypothetical protein [Halorussus]NHN58656.1 hypothetical protein [Halorussus sp. JP-T4]